MTWCRLGWRYVIRARGVALHRAVLTVSAVCLGTLVLSIALSLVHGSSARQHRGQELSPAPAADHAATFLTTSQEIPWRSHPLTIRILAPLSADAPPPPGMDRFPRPGEVWLSPALASARAHSDGQLRLPGRVAGRINDSGLVAPDQLLALAGARPDALAGAIRAGTWGIPGSEDTDLLVSQQALLVTVAGLVGLPLIAFGVTIGRLGSTARRRRAAALHLLGADTVTLARAAGVESGLLSGLGAALGLGLGVGIDPMLARHGVLGLSWFPSDTTPGAWTWLGVLLAVVAVMVVVARWGTRRALTSPITARQDTAGTPSIFRCVLVLVGIGLLAGLIVIEVSSPEGALSGLPMPVLFLIGALAGILGIMWALAPISARLGQRVRFTAQPAVLLAARRLTFDATATVRAVAALVLVTVCAVMGLAVINDVHWISRSSRSEHTIQLTLGGSGAMTRSLLALKTQASVLTMAADQSTRQLPIQVLVGTCSSLTHVAGSAPCHNGRTYRLPVSAEQVGGPIPDRLTVRGRPITIPTDTLRVPALDESALFGVAAVTVDPERYVGSIRRGEFLTAVAGRGDAAAENYVMAAIAKDPATLINYAGEDLVNEYRVPVIVRLVQACTALGLIVAVIIFAITTAEQARTRRRETTTLTVLGSSPRRARLAAAIQSAAVLTITAVMTAPVAWLAGAAYIAIGGHPGPFYEGAEVSGVSALGSIIIGTVIAAVGIDGKIRPDELKRE